jgi:hypothetical protein
VFIERNKQPDGELTYIISSESLMDVGDSSILIDNLRAMQAGETDAVPRFYAARPGSSALYRVDIETETIEDEPGQRRTKVFNANSGDMLEEITWYIEGTGDPGKPQEQDDPDIVWLLAESHPLPGRERRLVPVGCFKKKPKAYKWAQERLQLTESDASDAESHHHMGFVWRPVNGGLPGEEACAVWDDMFDATSKSALPSSIPFVVIPVPAKPKMTGGYRELWAERIAVLEQQDAPAKEIAEAAKNLDYARKWDS